MNKDYFCGTGINSWRKENSQQVTFVVTQDCNLRCRYCYVVNKNKNKRMSFEVGKKIIDYLIDNKEKMFYTDYLILDFIGGEPLLEIDLIDQLVDYFKVETYRRKCDWFGKYRISISTNGINYSDIKVQKFLKKNKNMVSIGITIDGIKEKHDMQRIFPDGSGSYDIVEKNVKLWLKQYCFASTKVTISHHDLPYLKESIIHLWNLGIRIVPANVVFEDVWKEGDDNVFENQLVELADYIIDNQLWNTYNTTLFTDRIGYKQTYDEKMRNYCGTGKSYAFDSEGKIYPCVRYVSHTLENKKDFCFGDIYNGIDFEKTRPFYASYTQIQSPDECDKCEVSTDCAFCQGFNYDVSLKDTIFDRNIAICKMHKARVRANNYYWAKLYNLYGIKKENHREAEKKLYFLLSDNCVEFCNFKVHGSGVISKENLLKGLQFAYKNFYQPIFVYSYKNLISDLLIDPDVKKELERHIIKHIYEYNGQIFFKDSILVFNNKNITLQINDHIENCILIVQTEDVEKIAVWVKRLLNKATRINLCFNLKDEKDLLEYKNQLKIIMNELCDYFINNKTREINVLTDRIFLNHMENCFAGEKNFTVGVDGKLYICPGFYFSKLQIAGDLDTGIMKPFIEKAGLEASPLCTICDAYHCKRCVYENKLITNELGIPSSIQCKKSHLEREISIELREFFKQNRMFEPYLQDIELIDYNDPLVKLKRLMHLEIS